MSCALSVDGGVRCWGWGDAGRLGHANAKTIGDDETPASAGDVAVEASVVRLSAGDHVAPRSARGRRVPHQAHDVLRERLGDAPAHVARRVGAGLPGDRA